MKNLKAAILKIEFELPVFLILAVRLPFSEMKTYLFSYMVLCFAAAWFFGQAIRRTEGGNGNIFILFFVAFLLSGDIMKSIFMPTAAMPVILYAKAASLLCFLLIFLMIRRPVPVFRKPFYYGLIPVVCFIGIFLSPSFVFFFIPIVLTMIYCEKFKTDKPGLISVFWTVLLGSLLISAAFITAGYFIGYKYMGIIPVGFAFRILSYGEIFKALAAVLPLIIIFAALWRDAYAKATDKKMKHIILLCAASPFYVILMNTFFYYASSDGWKYNIFITAFTQFCLLFYFLDLREKAVAGAFERIGVFFKKNPIVLLAVIIYLIKIADIFYNS